MRRAHADQYQRNGYSGGYSAGTQVMEEENQQREDQLSDKVKALKHLTIDIGTEVREQNAFLNSMTGDFDNTDSFLGKTMKRVQLMSRAGHNKFIFYLLAFCMLVFLIIWLMWKFK